MKQSTIAKVALFMTAALWGSTFTIGKLASEAFSASFIIAFRFLIAGIVLLILAYPQRKQLDRKYWGGGFWMGLTLFASYMLQVGGLSLDTSPGKSAFLCTTFGVLFSVIIYHEKITVRMLSGFAVIFIAILLSQWERKKRS